MSRLIVVRHGNTFASDEEPRRIGNRTDLPLARTGIAQAHALGRYFAQTELRVTRLLVAPLKRTAETADLIAIHLNAMPRIEIADWLVEIDHGPDEGSPEHDVIARIGVEALARWDADGMQPSGWIVNAEARLAAWRGLLAAADGGDTMLVTSNGVARFALLALPRPARPTHLKLRTGAFGVIAQGDRGADSAPGWHVVNWDVRP